MKNQQAINFLLLVLVSLTLVGCGTWEVDTTTISDPLEVAIVEEVKQEIPQERSWPPPWSEWWERTPRPEWWPGKPQPVDIQKNKELIAAREEELQQAEIKKDNDWNNQTITASEVVYPAKVWDTVEAHPAWLTVTVTLEDDIITALEIAQESSSPKSARHQAQFASQIESQVIGKKLSESDSIYLSVASSTSTAFNQSIKEIQELYTQSKS